MAVYDLEEQEKIATLKAWWDQYGNYVTGAVTVVCVIIIAVQGWRWYSRSQSEKAAVLYGAVSTATAQNNPDKAKDAGTQLLDKYPSSAYAARAALLLAKLAVDKKDNATAKTNLQWVIDRASEDELKQIALEKGFRHVASGPLVRSSYHAADFRPELDIMDEIEKTAPSHGLDLQPEDLPIPAARPALVKASVA